MRALDIMGCGGFLLTNLQPEISEYFKDGKDVVMYKSLEEAVDKACYYLAHDDERKNIARNGYKVVSDGFRFEDRIHNMFVLAGMEC